MCAGGLLLLALTPALAHGFLIRAVPPDGAVLERSPARVQYWFSESLEPAFSRITVRGPGGVVVAQAESDPQTPSVLAVRLPPELPDGTYLVELRLAFASDGHVIVESRSFSVGAPSGAGGVGAAAGIDPLEAVWRGGLLAGLMLSFGAAVTYNGVLLPAWGSRAHRAGGLPPRVMRRLTVLMWLGLAVALAAQVLALLQQTSAFFGADLAMVLSERLWEVVRASTRFGEVWTVRLLVLAAVGGVLGLAAFYQAEQPAWVRAAWAAAVPGLALGLAASSMISHAPGSRAEPWTALLLDWAHVTAAGFWAGGLATLAWVMPVALSPLSGEARRLAVLAAVRRYAPYALAALVVVSGSGIFSAVLWVRPAQLTTTSYGLALLVKTALVLGLMALALVHHMALNPARWGGLARLGARLGGFERTLPVAGVLGLVVVAAAGVLTALPVPVPPDALTSAPALTASTTVEGWDVGVTASPGGLGFNTFDITLSQGGQPVSGLTPYFQLSKPDADRRGLRVALDDLESGGYEAANADVTQAGVWWATIDIPTADGPPLRAAFALDFREENTVQLTVPLTAGQALALALATLAVSYALWRPLRALYRRLGLTAQSTVVVLLVMAVTVVAFVAGLALVDQTSQAYNAAFNAPPRVVNPALPDQPSLMRGREVLSACGWAQEQAGWADLRARLPRTRDQELYDFIGTGYRGMPACPRLSEAERWDAVNALRAALSE